MASALSRWEPITDLSDLRNRFDRMFEDLGMGLERPFRPAVDVVREDGNMIVRADIPGMTADDVRIEIEDDILTVSGEHEAEHEEEGQRFIRRERRYGSFSRSLALPAGVDPKEIKAHTHDGLLEVTVPMPEEKRHEAITIKPVED